MRPAVMAFLLLVLIACTSETLPVGPAAESASNKRKSIDPGLMVADPPYRGEILFVEKFDDASLETRGWYDVDQPRITKTQKAPGSRSSFECRFARGQSECTGGVPGRHLFTALDELYFSYWVRYDSNWIGSGKPYHPHEFYFMTTANDKWVGPAFTRLTVYVEQLAGRPRVALQDAANVDPDCILRNDDSLVGCAGHTIDTYPFGENRSVAACNGLAGPVDGRDCYSLGGGRWYSARFWHGPTTVLGGGSGWHFVETYVRLNSVVDDRGLADGEILQWVDGTASIALQGVLFRTGANAAMQLNQLLFAPYMGDGSPVDQTVWFDDLTVARGRRP